MEEATLVTLGVSVYPDIRPLDEIEEYLALAAHYGFSRVFTSFFSVKGRNDEVLLCFKRLIAAAHAHGMEVALDIDPVCMARFGAAPEDLGVFASIGADILRMDGAYGEDQNLSMLQNPYGMRIEYNASALAPHSIERLVARGACGDRILACHNFYPQRYTGFRWDRYQEVTERLVTLGLRVGAFIASQAEGTHGVWDATCGLPTVERLRDYPADLQARMLAAVGTTDILFGNAYASEAELAAVREALMPVEPHFLSDAHRLQTERMSSYTGVDLDLLNQKKVRVEPLYDLSAVERQILFDYFPHVDMGDSSEWIWRSRGPRVPYAGVPIAPRRHAAETFLPGDVVMVNDNYKHYAGEVQVVLAPIKNDGTRNLVAHISDEERDMFDTIRDGDVVIFLPQR